MTWFANRRVGTRLAIAFGLLAVLIGATTMVGIRALAAEGAAGRAVADSSRLTFDAMQAKFRTADFAGWQTGYSFDILRGIPDASHDDVFQRKEFLASTAAFRDDLAHIRRHPLSPAQTGQLAAAEAAFEKFMAVDDRIIAAFRVGTPAKVNEATELASGESLDWFAKARTAVDELVADVLAHNDRVSAAAERQGRRSELLMVLAAGVCLLLAVALAVLVTRSVTGPLGRVVAMLRAVAGRDFTALLPVRSRDEVGQLTGALNTTVSGVREALTAISGSLQAVTCAGTELSATNEQIAATAAETSQQAGTVAAAARQVSGNVQTLAAGAAEMGTSIKEIAYNAAEGGKIATKAVEAIESTNRTVGKLGVSSAEIGSVVKLINSIAGQTNLLALNATIEAARAGEAGKGFAVVAGEVKELARETANATEDISRRVAAIQNDSDLAGAAIAEVSRIIGEIHAFQVAIAAAVEEQTATTGSMDRSVTEVAARSEEIAHSVGGVAAAAQAASQHVGSNQQLAVRLAAMSREAADLIATYRF
jgi:methyl-accepting chemotaxis protein